MAAKASMPKVDSEDYSTDSDDAKDHCALTECTVFLNIFLRDPFLTYLRSFFVEKCVKSHNMCIITR